MTNKNMEGSLVKQLNKDMLTWDSQRGQKNVDELLREVSDLDALYFLSRQAGSRTNLTTTKLVAFATPVLSLDATILVGEHAFDAIFGAEIIVALVVLTVFMVISLNRHTINLGLKTAIDRRIRDVEATQQADREVVQHA